MTMRTFLATIIAMVASTADLRAQDCNDGEMSNGQKSDVLKDSLDDLRNENYTGDSPPNSPDFFDANVRPTIIVGPHKSDFIAGVLVKPNGDLGNILVNLNGMYGLDECLKDCPNAFGAMLDILLQHELNNTPGSAGGGDMPDDPKGDEPTPIQEVANVYDSMKKACMAAEDADETGQVPESSVTGTEESDCAVKAMCALHEKLSETMTEGNPEHAGGDGVEGSPSEMNGPGYADEIKENGGEEVPGFEGDNDLPPAGETPDGGCAIELPPCYPCENLDGDAGTEGDGAADGGGGSTGTGGSGGGSTGG